MRPEALHDSLLELSFVSVESYPVFSKLDVFLSLNDHHWCTCLALKDETFKFRLVDILNTDVNLLVRSALANV